MTAYDPNYSTPYTQNLTLSVTRTLPKKMVLDVRWVGTLARKQAGNLNLNTVNVFYNPELLDALERTRKGENVDLFDKMFAGLDLNTAAGYGPIGTCTALAGAPADAYCPAGTVRERGSEHLRRWQAGGTAANLANGNYAGVIATLLGTNAPQGGYYGVTGGTGLPTGITSFPTGISATVATASQTVCTIPARRLRRQTFGSGASPRITLQQTPQLNPATYNSNLGRSSHHQLQVQYTMRDTAGFSFQSTYTWAKAMQIPGAGYSDPLQRNLDRRRGQEAPHSFRMNGQIELPIGPNKLLFGNTSGWIARAIEGWKTSFILNLESGSPADITGAGTMRYANGRYVATGPFPDSGRTGRMGRFQRKPGRFYGTTPIFAWSILSAAIRPI